LTNKTAIGTDTAQETQEVTPFSLTLDKKPKGKENQSKQATKKSQERVPSKEKKQKPVTIEPEIVQDTPQFDRIHSHLYPPHPHQHQQHQQRVLQPLRFISQPQIGLMNIPSQLMGDKAYHVGNFFDYGNDYNRVLVDAHDNYDQHQPQHY
jgi:hypothetical protein